MGKINAGRKGAAFEREICDWLDLHLGIKTQRLLGQAREGGADIETEDFLIEAKRRESLDLYSWWNQVLRAKREHPNEDIIPVVVFKQNRQEIKWLIPANLLPNVEKGYMIVSSAVFKQFAKGILDGTGERH